MISNGEEAAAVERMRHLAGMGFNLVRVLATAEHLFTLPADQGRAHLRRLFDLALAEHLYVEVVALADTEDWPKGQLEAQLYEVYQKACDFPNVLVEGGNEIGPVHETQADASVEVCRAFRPSGPALYCPGSVHGGGFCDEQASLTQEQWDHGCATGEWPYWDEVHTYVKDYGTSHLKRDGSDAMRSAGARARVQQRSGRPLCSWTTSRSGADETSQPGRRSNEPGVFYLQGVLSRIFETGSTFHSTAGLHSLPFGPMQQQCAEGFIGGTSYRRGRRATHVQEHRLA